MHVYGDCPSLYEMQRASSNGQQVPLGGTEGPKVYFHRFIPVGDYPRLPITMQRTEHNTPESIQLITGTVYDADTPAAFGCLALASFDNSIRDCKALVMVTLDPNIGLDGEADALLGLFTTAAAHSLIGASVS